MKIKDVLALKGSRVISVHYEQRADAIPALFSERNISSVAVQSADGRLLGIITDRLILKALARRGASLQQFLAADIMESPAPACRPETSVAEAMRMMTDQRVRHLVVLDNGRLAGLVSIGDLVKSQIKDYELESRVLRDMALGHLAAE